MKQTVLSPGEHLKALLVTLNMKNADLAVAMGRSAQYVTDIIKGKKAMDVDLAIELDHALPGKISAQRWMQYAIAYRLASQEPTRSEVLANHPYAKELVRLKWVDGTKSPRELEEELQAFWALKDVAANFKQSPAHIVNDDARRAWAIQVHRLANMPETGEIKPYNKKNFDKMVTALKRLMAEPEGVLKLKDTLASFGIRCVYLVNPKQCPVDGIASMNLTPDGNRPYIGLSLRIARLDSFWFTVMHELMHIKHEHSNTAPDTIDASPDNDPCEMEANDDAREAILSDNEYLRFVKRGDFSLNTIKVAAHGLGLHHSILIGRMKKDHFLDWSQFAREHPGVRELLIADAA